MIILETLNIIGQEMSALVESMMYCLSSVLEMSKRFTASTLMNWKLKSCNLPRKI